MPWRKLRLELARSPAYPEGSRHHGYLLNAPLDRSGRIDVAAYEAGQNRAVVEEFWADREPRRGRFVRHRRNLWCFAFGMEEEPIFHFGDHRFVPGEYVTVRDLSGKDLTFRIAESSRANAEDDHAR